MIGMELGGRYDIIARIGGGGMAIVYKAHDTILNRKVAIKVLRQQFVHDEDFIRRFGREAQSAASLSHPNVVSIYDVGQEEEIHYIVMEYVEGSNLNEKIKERAPFQVEEAVHIASQICDALDHAHHNQIIHRDIKPHNILIGKNGRVKVTDFGIARAAASSEITQTGSVIGSVHYFSPEHAKGVSQGEKSDIYSLGIVLYQMLTNKLPFLGESPISVALKHLQEHVEEPRKVNSLIPQSVENIILKALRKNPHDRYRSAKDMLEDLDSCLLPERLNEPKLMFNEDEDESDDQKTIIMPAIRSERNIERSRSDRNEQSFTSNHRDFSELHEMEKADERWAKRNKWLKPVIWSAVIIILLIVAWSGIRYVLKLIEPPPDVLVPEVIGMTLEEATTELETVNLTVADPILYEYDNEHEEGHVIDQDKLGISVKEHSSVSLTVSLGIEEDLMPDYIGQMWRNVEVSLGNLGFHEEQIEHELVTNEEPAGTVLEQYPEPGEAYDLEEMTVRFVVSEGLGSFDMPDLLGKTLSEVEVILEKADLKLDPDGPRYDASFSIAEDRVFKQFPKEPGDPVSPGEEISIWISTGFPEDAISTTWNMYVEPGGEGEPSNIKMTIRDARGERERDPVQITSFTTFPVQIVVSPDQFATITVLSNDRVYDSVTVTYIDAQSGQPPRQVPELPSQPDPEPEAESMPEPEELAEPVNTEEDSGGAD